MRSYNIQTRTIPPTETKDKRVRLDSAMGTTNHYPWDHNVPEEDAHLNVALRVAQEENPEGTVTAKRIRTAVNGFTFRVTVGEAE